LINIGLGIVSIILTNSGLFTPHLLIWVLGILVGVGLLWIGWLYLEWSNDVFYFTVDRIITIHRVLFSSESKQETPLTAIKSIKVNRGIIGRNLNFGDLEIKTYTGSMSLPFMPNITNAQRILRFLMDRRSVQKEKEARNEFEVKIRERIFKNGSNANSRLKDTAQEISELNDGQGVPQLNIPIENGTDRIEYRKHWTILFAKVFIPVALLISHILLYTFLVVNQFELIDESIFKWVFSINCIGLLYWAIFRFIDWRNDLYIITNDQLIDIDRHPFGMEEKRTAPIQNIQSIRYKRNGIFGLLLNYGTVFIRIGDEEFTFDNVHRPSEVQERVFSVKERYQRMKENAQKRAMQRDAVGWLDTYHRIVKEETGKDPKD
ncbi:MAG: PH domain-containing protein, partial [Anaerolineaceae bacterium]|nr:PH domain-containing protein [Anaerolineaceae bacterium]